MPYTPYHFGPNGLVGLLFRRWLDLPMLLLVNVIIDVEVLADNYFQPGWPSHQFWHFHTLLIGGLVGAALGLIIYFINNVPRQDHNKVWLVLCYSVRGENGNMTSWHKFPLLS